MIRERVVRYRERARRDLTAAFREEHTEHEVATSFAIGVFVTALPTGGLGIGLFFLLVSLWPWISKPAIFASVAVLNPLVKPLVYVASFQVGGLFVSTPPITDAAPSTDMAAAAAAQLLVGNVVLAILFALVGYGVVLHLTRVNRRRRSSP